MFKHDLKSICTYGLVVSPDSSSATGLVCSRLLMETRSWTSWTWVCPRITILTYCAKEINYTNWATEGRYQLPLLAKRPDTLQKAIWFTRQGKNTVSSSIDPRKFVFWTEHFSDTEWQKVIEEQRNKLFSRWSVISCFSGTFVCPVRQVMLESSIQIFAG